MGIYLNFGLQHYELADDSPEIEALIANLNDKHAGWYYGYVALIFFIFLGMYWGRKYYIRSAPRQRKSLQPVVIPLRVLRKFFIQKAFYPFTTYGHTAIIIGFIFMNFILSIHSVEMRLQTLQLARRTGWLSAINFTLFMFFSMKNTPLAKLIGYSYERLNVFHRWIATIAFIQGAVHTIAITIAVSRLNPPQTHVLLYAENVMGIILLVAWFITMMIFPILKVRSYEWFYTLHMFLFPVIVITLFLHNPHAQGSVAAGMIFYILDRIIRTDRYIWHNRYAKYLKATLKILPDSSVLVSVPRGDLHWVPGSHAFINVPRVQYWQSHPFTIASVGDDFSKLGQIKQVQFIIKPQKGFTKGLFAEATKPADVHEKGLSREMVAYIDGPYGGAPDFSRWDTVVLIAAGSGITFTLPVALSLVRERKIKHLHFIWSVRDMRSIEGIRTELEEIARHALTHYEDFQLNFKLQITGKTPASGPGMLQRIKTVVMREPQQPSTYDLYRRDEPQNISDLLPGMYTGSNRSTVDFSQYSGENPNNPIYQAYNPDQHTTGGFLNPNPQHVRSPSVASDVSQGLVENQTVATPLSTPGEERSEAPLESPPPLLSMGRFQGTRSVGFMPDAPGQQSANKYRESDQFSETTLRPESSQNVRASVTTSLLAGEDNDSDDEKSRPKSRARRTSMRDPLKQFIHNGRPSIPTLIKEAVTIMSETGTVAIGACGVTAMTDEVRAAAAANIYTTGPSVSVFCEEFGW